ncbi:hypothetical protein [Hymenobacter sediminicola]|uniref:DUF3298 domain-containing protein n=1 Tax=Hymenobacter sediminicola TaxID=2761579 RepID=A0A7G7W9B1_9BACT|nr:hypothetical protein [Hymenobacter sediminicola]QNH62954.1 hypothetical protein H4317_03845 [Hymenobacter sediminicola]
MLLRNCSLFLLLAACWSCDQKAPATSAAPAAINSQVPEVTAPRPSVAAVLGDYEGTMAGKYAFRLSITAQQPDSQLVGMYYYLSQHKPIELQGFVAPTGEIWLREFAGQSSGEELERPPGNEAPTPSRQPSARFMVRRSPDGSLAGTWQEANSERSLPVQLTRYPSPNLARQTPTGLQAHVGQQVYFEEFTVPVFTVPNPGVTRRLHEIFGVEQLTEMTLAELQEEHQQHQAAEYAQGFAGVDAEVTHNSQGLLSVNLHSEYTGANVNHSYRTVVVDLHTGEQLTDEINPARQPQFLAACEQKLQAKLATYIREEYGQMMAGIPPEEDENLAGLRSQHISLQNQPDDMSIEAGKVLFHYPVQYEAMSNLMFKQFQSQFWLDFSFAELQPFLRPSSPLRRLTQR